MKRFSTVVILLPLLAACGGGGGGSSTSPTLLTATATSGLLSEAQSDTQYQATRQALSSSGANDLLYVGNTGNNSITVYRHDASGNAAPLYVIAGSNTELRNPGQLSEDAGGNLYVANNDSLLVFAHGANGNVAPIRKLAGPLTGIHQITAMTVDKTTGKIFIGDLPPNSDPFSDPILRFAPNASGNTAPFARSAAALYANNFASDSTGKNLIITGAVFAESHDQVIVTVAKQFDNGTRPLVLFRISSIFARGVADDPTTKTYLISGFSGVSRFAENTVGYGADAGYPASFSPAVVATITNDTCGSKFAVAPGPTPNTYVSHGTQNMCPADAVYVYTHDASGNAMPLRVLSGSATKMNQPYGMYEGM